MSTLRSRTLLAALAATALTAAAPSQASAEAMLLIEADTGKVLHAQNATLPWYPASITKLMTAYVTLHAVRRRQLTLDTLITVSSRAAAQQPSKMGFKSGTRLTVDNALKMIMVKSANDVSVVLAEGVSGSVEKFAAEMNRAAEQLGMTQSNFVNPNGLPAENQISSARDLAILTRALIVELPEYEMYWDIPAIRFGKRVMRNYNTLIGRYDGADGMKTGFICASGFNLVATATRKGKRLIAVVLGSPSSAVRGAKTAALLERGFNRGALSWLAPSLGTVDQLAPMAAAPPDLRDAMCGPQRKRPAAEEADEEPNGTVPDPDAPQGFMLSSLPPSNGKPSSLLASRPAAANPIVVHAGPSKRSAEAQVAAVRAKLIKAGKLAKADIRTFATASAVPIPRGTPASQAQAAAVPMPPAPPTAAIPTPPPAPGTAAAAHRAKADEIATVSAAPATGPRKPVKQVAAKPDSAKDNSAKFEPAKQDVELSSTQAPSAMAGAFAPPPDRFTPPTARTMPAATDLGNPPWMSFAPAAQAAPAPLTAIPPEPPGPQDASVPMPRPRPKIAAAKPKPATSKPKVAGSKRKRR